MNRSDIVAAVAPVVEAFEELAVDYSVVGSVASSAHGMARATVDVDLVADLGAGQVDRLVEILEETYYIDRDMALDAIHRRRMFNVVHLATMLKVDVYILTDRHFDQESFRRRALTPLEPGTGGRSFFVDTAEDTLLHKLEWYRDGGEVSERQWNDVVGVVRVQAGALDLEYLREWAARLDVAELLERALSEPT